MKSLALGAILLTSLPVYAQTEANEVPPEEAKPVKPQGLVVPVSIMGGIRVAGAFKLGMVAPDATNKPNDAVGGFDLGLEVGSLVFDHIYGGLILGGTFFISPQSSTANVASMLLGTEFAYLTNPKGLGGFFGAGVGYRVVFVSDSLGNALHFDSPDVLFTIALHLRLASYLRVMPRIDISLGPTNNADAHAIFTLGLSAWFNADVHPKKKRASDN
jgi:hypothetical protein